MTENAKKKKKQEEVMAAWTNLKQKITNSWKDGRVVVYRKVLGPEQVPSEEAIKDLGGYGNYQKILAELGVNTHGTNQPAILYATYDQVIEAIQDFKERTIKTADRYYESKIELAVSEKAKLTQQLKQVKQLVDNNELEKLKRLMRKGEI